MHSSDGENGIPADQRTILPLSFKGEAFRQVAGEWLIAHDIFKSDLTPPKQGL